MGRVAGSDNVEVMMLTQKWATHPTVAVAASGRDSLCLAHGPVIARSQNAAGLGTSAASGTPGGNAAIAFVMLYALL